MLYKCKKYFANFKRLSRANGMLSKLRHYVSRDILLSLYYSLFHSHLSYAANVWALNTNATKSVLLLQKKAVRLMTFSKFNSHSFPLFTQLRILPFQDFVKFFFSSTFWIKIFLRPFMKHLIWEIWLVSRRTKTGLLRLPQVCTLRFGNYSLNQAVVSWNLLQQNINVDNLLSLPINKLKYWAKFYFLSSYI